MSRVIYGLPKYTDDIDELLMKKSLTTAEDIPQPAGVDAGANAGGNQQIDPINGIKGPNTDTEDRYFWDGSTDAKSWAGSQAINSELADTGFTVYLEIHRDIINGTLTDNFLGTAEYTPFLLRNSGDVVYGVLKFAIGSGDNDGIGIGNEVYDTQLAADIQGVTTGRQRLSRWGTNKEFIPFVVSFRQGVVDVYVDGLHTESMVRVPEDMCTQMVLGGGTHTKNSTPKNFPVWMRNFMVIKRPVVLPIHPRWGRIGFIGDSNMALGGHSVDTPRDDGVNTGNNCDAGLIPMVQKLLAQDGIYTSETWNCGRGSCEINSGAQRPLKMVYDLTTPQPFTDYQVLDIKPSIIVSWAGYNDARNGVETMAALKIDYQEVITHLSNNGVEHFVLINIPDPVNDLASNADRSARAVAINAILLELEAENANVHVVDAYTALGGANISGGVDTFRQETQPIHFNERPHSIIGKLVYQKMKEKFL